MAKVSFYYKTSTAWNAMSSYTAGALYFVSDGQGSLNLYRASSATAVEQVNKSDIDDIYDLLVTLSGEISDIRDHVPGLMQLKGSFGQGQTQTVLPTSGSKNGDAWRCDVAGTYTVPIYGAPNHTEKLEVGDVCVMIGDSGDIHWMVLQNNIDTEAFVPKTAVTSKGNSTTPVYFNASGQAVACDLSGTYAAKSHSHNYAGSASAGGAANSVKTNLVIKLNGGSTEGTNLFTFNGSTAKTVNITPSAIGAAASSHSHTFDSLTSKPTTLAGYGITDAAAASHTHSYLPLSGGALTGPIVIGTNGASISYNSTEARLEISEDLYLADDLYVENIIYEEGRSLSEKYAAKSHSHTFDSLTSKPTTLAGYGITDAKIANGVITLGSNTITPLTAHQDISGKKNVQSAVSDPTASGNALSFIATISQNTQGVISVTKKTVSTMGAASASAAGTAGLVPAPAANKHTSFLRGDGTWVVPTNTTYSAGTGLSLSSTTFSLATSGVTAGTYKSVTVDAYGRVTAGSNPTTLAGYGITDAAAAADLEWKS